MTHSRPHNEDVEASRLEFKLFDSQTHIDLWHHHTHRFSSSKWARIFSSSPLLSVARLHGACCPKAVSRSVMGLECRSRYWSSSLHGCGERKGGGQGLNQETYQGMSSQLPYQVSGDMLEDSLLNHIEGERLYIQV